MTDPPRKPDDDRVPPAATPAPVTGAVAATAARPTARRGGGAALLVAAGILLSRIAGLVRERATAHYFGDSLAADALRAAFRIPNQLQNLFGEGVLSASFIPVYAGLLARGERDEADRVAGAVATLLALVTALFTLLGIALAPALVTVITPGFKGEARELTIVLVRVLFPGAGLLVMSAWCLGILNSHRRFFLSYAAPVIWNAAIITALVAAGARVALPALAWVFAWGAVIGSALQFAVQLPTVLRLTGRLRPTLDTASANVRTVVRNFGPVFVSRGVFQISAFIDTIFASLLPTGAVAVLGYAQALYMLPVSLFGMSVSAAELPAMASAVGDEREIAAQLRSRLDAGLRQIAFFVIPSAVAFIALGDVVAATLYQTGRFTRQDTLYVWGVLAASTLGLVATTFGRLYSSAYYALRDTRTPLRYAMVHVALAALLGYLLAIHLPPLLGLERKWGVAGLSASAGLAGWVEFLLLRRTLNARIGHTGLPALIAARLWAIAAAAAAVAWGAKLALGVSRPILLGVVALGLYGVVYVGLAWALGSPEARSGVERLLRRAGGGRR